MSAGGTSGSERRGRLRPLLAKASLRLSTGQTTNRFSFETKDIQIFKRGLRANDVKNHVNRLTYCFILIIRCCIYSYSNDHGADGRWNAIPSRGQFGDRKFLYVKRII